MKKLFDKLPVTLTPHAIWYPILSVFSLMLAQGLKMPITYTIFLFAVLCPLGVILQLVIARLSLRVSFRVSSQQPRKNTPFIATATVKNKWALPLPFIKAVMTLPDKYGERDQSVSFLFSLLPFSAKSIDQTVEYAFRGEHSLGVDCIFVYDFMRTVRLRIP